MKSNWSGRVLRYGPLILWFSFILYASSEKMSNENTSKVIYPILNWLFSSPSEHTIYFLNVVIRKSAHFIEYAILTFILARALLSSSKKWVNINWFAWSLTIISICALLDEFHQSFEPSRMSSIYDCLIDITGGLTVLLFFKWKKYCQIKNTNALPIMANEPQ